MKFPRLLSSLTAAVMTVLAIGTPPTSAEEAASGGTPLRVMELGDSITDGFNVTGGYRIPLWYQLSEAGYIDRYSIDFVGPNGWYLDGVCDTDHAGYSGYSIDDIPNQRTGLYSFIDWLMENYPADIVMLQIGTNDILSSWELDTAGDRLELLVDTILTYIPEDGMLFLATIPYMDADVTTYTDAYTVEEMDKAVDDYNAAVRALVEKEQAAGKPVLLSDNNAALTKADLADGVHPSEDGYRKLGAHWYDVLTSYLDTGAAETTGPSESTTEASAETSETTTETTTETSAETTTETEPTTEPLVTVGDINLDQYVNLPDVIALQKHLLHIELLTAMQEMAADVNNDGAVNIFDLGKLKNSIFTIHQ